MTRRPERFDDERIAVTRDFVVEGQAVSPELALALVAEVERLREVALAAAGFVSLAALDSGFTMGLTATKDAFAWLEGTLKAAEAAGGPT